MIIDAHTHILPQRRLNGLSIWLDRVFPTHPLAGQRFTEDLIIEELNQNGVNYAFNYVFSMNENETEGLNLFNKKLSEKFSSVIPFGCLHVENKDKKNIVDLCVKDYGFLGFKLHPYVQGFSPDDERLFPAYERMEEYGVMVNIHIGFDDYYPQKVKPITLSMIEDLIKRFSSLMFIIPHMSYPRLEEAAYLLENYKNVTVDTTNVFSAIIQDEEKGINMDNEREFILEVLDKWSNRMVFGTDHPTGMSSLDVIFKDFYSFNFKKNIISDLLFNTANSLMGGDSVA